MLRNHRLAVGLYSDGPDGLDPHRAGWSSTWPGARTEVPELVGHPAADLVLVNDDDLTYAKLRLDERSLATLRTPDRQRSPTRWPGRCAGRPPGT